MPRGGARLGAGRPRKKSAPVPAELDPVAYALSVMRDPEADPKRRDSMARTLLSYMRGAGKPDEKLAPADKAAARDDWDVILGGKK